MTATTLDVIAAEIAAATSAEDRRIIVAPILRSLSDGAEGSYLFVTFITTGFRCWKIHLADPIERLKIVGRLYAHQPPLELHFPDDEIATLKLAAEFWPCEQVAMLLKEAEAALAAH
jgi:hypothetical protein